MTSRRLRSTSTWRSSTTYNGGCTRVWPSSTTSSDVARKARLDAELVRRGLARSRQHAVDLVNDGKVRIAGLPAHKVATAVDPATPLQVAIGSDDDVVSRGAHTLAGALD